jgi:hypothetical protein
MSEQYWLLASLQAERMPCTPFQILERKKERKEEKRRGWC